MICAKLAGAEAISSATTSPTLGLAAREDAGPTCHRAVAPKTIAASGSQYDREKSLNLRMVHYSS